MRLPVHTGVVGIYPVRHQPGAGPLLPKEGLSLDLLFTQSDLVGGSRGTPLSRNFCLSRVTSLFPGSFCFCFILLSPVEGVLETSINGGVDCTK